MVTPFGGGSGPGGTSIAKDPRKRTPTPKPTRYQSADMQERTAQYLPIANERGGPAAYSYDNWLNRSIGVGQAYLGTAPTTSTTPTNGPGGGGDGGAAARQRAAAENAIRVLFSKYNQAPDMSLDQDIDRQVGEAQGTANTALAQLTALLSSQQNPYQNTVQAATTAVNPLAEYMQQTGASTAGVDALRSMLQAGNADMAAAGQNMNDRQAQSWQNSQGSRQADAGFQSQQFNQGLASNAATAKTNLAAQRRKDKDAMMNQILQYAISNGIDLAKLGIAF